MTDEMFNSYLVELTRGTIGLMLESDARVEIHSGVVMLVSSDRERMIPLMPREGAAIAFGVEQAYAELARRDFERKNR